MSNVARVRLKGRGGIRKFANRNKNLSDGVGNDFAVSHADFNA